MKFTSFKRSIRDILLLSYVACCQISRAVKTALRQRPVPPDMELAECGVCGGLRAWYLYSKRDRLQYANVRRGYTFDLAKCRECGHVYVSPRLKEETLREIYENDLFETCKYDPCHQVKKNILYDGYHDRLNDRLRFFEGYMAVILKHKAAGRILDIGTSFAYFLKTAEKYGFETYGIELSKQCVQFSKEVLQIPNVMQGAFLDMRLEIASFEVVTLWHTIEHLHRPAAAVRRISDVLAPGGYLFLTCPIHKERFLVKGVQPIEHLHYFTHKTLLRLVLANFEGDFVEENQKVFVFRKREGSSLSASSSSQKCSS